MVESFPGRNSQQIRPYLPPHRCGGSPSRFIFSLSPVCCDMVLGVIPAPCLKADAECAVMPVKATAPTSRRLFSFHLCYGLIRKPTSFVNKTPSTQGRTVSETNCKVPLWEDKKQ